MQFTDQEIAWARRLRRLGLPWTPQPGHFVWDEAGIIEPPSPFQPQVYFILDLKHFLRRTTTLEALKAAMVWLPTWHDARVILRHLDVPAHTIADALEAQAALQRGTELLTLYGLIAATYCAPKHTVPRSPERSGLQRPGGAEGPNRVAAGHAPPRTLPPIAVRSTKAAETTARGRTR